MTRRFCSLALGVSLFVAFVLACSTNPRSPAATAKVSRGALALASRGGNPDEPDLERQERARAAWAAREAVGEDGGAVVVYPVLSGLSPAVRDLKPERIESDLPADREGPENPTGRLTRPSSSSVTTQGIKHDPVIQSTAGGIGMPPPIQNFEGQFNESNFTQFGFRLSPPDTNGDVGPNHYVQQVNLLVQVWSKTGTPLAGPFKMSSLYSGVGGVCSLPDEGDPVVLYDPLADRWLLSQFGFADPDFPPYHQCIAVSKTGDPTGQYYVYDFITPGKEFPDYPKLGVWPDGYYMTTNQFFNFNVSFDGAGVFSFDRKKMLVGDPTASMIYFNLNLATHPEGVFGMLPSDLDGFTPPPPGRPNTFAYFIANDFGDPADGLRLFDFHSNFVNPGLSTFTERPESTYAAPIPVAPFDLTQPGGRSQIPQPPPATSATGVDAIADRLLHRLQYRNFGTHETLVMNHTVGAPGSTTFGTFRAAPRYYVLNRPLPGGNFAVADQATFAPADGVNRWMGSAAMDHEGNLALGYSVSNATTVFPGIRYAGRLATDPPGSGLAQGENTLINGTGSQTSTASRWGDYSMLAVDPVDDCTFWYTQEYYTASGTPANTRPWRTRIGSFKTNPSCVTAPHGQFQGTITYCDTGLPAVGTTVEVSDGHSAPVAPDGSFYLLLAPGNYTVQVVGPGCASAPVPAVVVNNGTTFYNACVTGSPAFRATSESVSGGNADGIIEQNECNKLFVTLNNIGCAKDTGITATLASSTPGVTVDPTAVPYPDMNERASGTNTIPFAVSTSSSFACGTPIAFTMTVNGSGGTETVNFSMPTCTKAPIAFSGSIVAGDPTQTGRVNRNGVTSICEVEPYPGTVAGTFRFKAFSFANDGDVTACANISVTTSCAVYYTAYLNTFNPASISTNFLGAPGVSVAPGTATWSVNVPAHSTLVVVINATSTALCSGFTGSVSGLLTDTDGGGDCAGSQLTALSPANVWLGLKNSDDVGTNFDLKAEVYKNNTIVGTGEIFNVSGGSSGFNNARERAIALALTQSNVFFLGGDKLSIKLYARIGATGHRSGTARLWFNDAQADTEFDATIGGVTNDWYIRAGGGLETTPGGGPKTTNDLFLDRLVGGNPYKLFGAWTHTF